ncbi:sorbitol-6-phosphate 2-dehydrogenase [Spiroplasma litorale]|uniref:Sorbitol-6-phosphate 2-dehydrogenase n=2 Tax=Spiroplasma litorale TaxID=216942 RepID=A0A0K1W1W0_9MOLU|nr:sorbitol-6-phosphate dehydrogenase [Spiroplasma litorale]AKX34300.1 sorbitol-6-phosphate 2-dehydrogenase [Spiroplasma litorale]
MEVLVIAGGARSLGKYLSIKFSEKKYKVIVLDIDENSLNELKKENDNLITYVCDLTDEKNVINTFDNIDKEYGGINKFIYNAGYANSNIITKFEYDKFITSLNINLNGYFLCSKEVAKNMIKYNIKGSIAQINSKSGRVGSKHNSGYSAAKFGAVGLTQSLALDLAEYNIRVNSFMLGNLLDSEMFESLIPQYAKKLNIKESEVKQYYIDKVPLKRGCSFEDVFNILEFYISDKANYCTGQSINLTGGQVM